mmetsp:Transcript_7265/g.10950  ORF Transcript_7265/g.10950 Transcript_7265/m.10950 type:complete len:90 (+) Transcript_7265:142-411(+)
MNSFISAPLSSCRLWLVGDNDDDGCNDGICDGDNDGFAEAVGKNDGFVDGDGDGWSETDGDHDSQPMMCVAEEPNSPPEATSMLSYVME